MNLRSPVGDTNLRIRKTQTSGYTKRRIRCLERISISCRICCYISVMSYTNGIGIYCNNASLLLYRKHMDWYYWPGTRGWLEINNYRRKTVVQKLVNKQPRQRQEFTTLWSVELGRSRQMGRPGLCFRANLHLRSFRWDCFTWKEIYN